MTGVHVIVVEVVVPQYEMSRFTITVDDASAVVLMEKRWQRQPPPLEQCSWLNP
jgi:hypothetical protein